MADVLDGFITKKKAESDFISLADGESVVVKLRNIKLVTKTAFGGDEKEVIRLECDVETDFGVRTKKFDNGTQRFAEEMKKQNVVVGSTFKITREGTQTKTRYLISEVVQPTAAAPAAPKA